MALANGTQLGPYEILNLLGIGSMGEVYRARDGRLDREVAVKVLPSDLAKDTDRLRRFEQEARAVALLNHPNILHIYDTGVVDDYPYLVMELLHGETLRSRISFGPIPQKKALDFAHQIALGLAAAHAKGIVHRDLKPENCFIIEGERIKILDFGLAKFHHPLPSHAESTAPRREHPLETQVGALVGTAGYMSPEQVSGGCVDPRSDLFSLGIILWEMISRERPFRGHSMVELLHAILKDEPQSLPSSINIPYSLQRILDRCLEKSPSARYQNALDLAFALDGQKMSSISESWPLRMPRIFRGIPIGAKGLALASSLMLVGGAFWTGKTAIKPEPRIARLTFHNTRLGHARLTPGGDSYVFSMEQNDGKIKLWLGRIGSPGARPLDVPEGSDILAISSRGEMALRLPDKVLALAPLSGGGAPRKLLEKIGSVDWSPDGNDLVILKRERGRCRLEYPMGHPIFLSDPACSCRLSSPRVSPDGEKVTYLDLSTKGVRRIWVSDKSGQRELLAEGEVETPAWQPDGQEVIFMEKCQNQYSLVGVTLEKKRRIVYTSAERLKIRDVSKSGAVLLEQELARRQLIIQKGDTEKDLSWLDCSSLADISRDGSGVLFGEHIDSRGRGASYFRPADTSDATRLTSGRPLAMSHDGRCSLVISLDGKCTLTLVPMGPGSSRRLPDNEISVQFGVFSHNDSHLILGAIDMEGSFRCFKQDIQSGDIVSWGPAFLEPESRLAAGPGTDKVAVAPIGGKIHIFSSDGRLLKVLDGFPDARPLQWCPNGRHVFVAQMESLPVKIWRVDTETGQRSLWKLAGPKTLSGVKAINNLAITPDGSTVACSFDRLLSSDLYWMTFVKE